jgi:uncharacterized protein (DUF2252 family)
VSASTRLAQDARLSADTARQVIGAPSPELTREERKRLGRHAREHAPRSSHAVWEPPAGRPDPIALLEQQAATRIPELVPIRYSRMVASPFAFFRGAALVMAWDLARTPDSGTRVQACGDAHLSNFGGFASPERALVFDVNDFDETLPGPWEWDLKRLAASAAVAGRARGLDRRARRLMLLGIVRRYREAMRRFAGLRNLEVWYSQLSADVLREALSGLRAGQRRRVQSGVERAVEKAETKDSMRALAKLTAVVDGRLQIVSSPPTIVRAADMPGAERLSELEGLIATLLGRYRASLPDERRRLLEDYRFVDIAHKVVGVGSVGTRCWILLLEGRSRKQDPLFLQFKEAGPSVLERFLPASEFSSHGRRVVEGQRLMQSASDILLGWLEGPSEWGEPRDFYGRQLWDWKISADIDTMSPRTIVLYAEMCAWTLARAHARSGDRVAIASYLGGGDTFDRAIAQFAELYADQSERDHRALLDAVTAGRVITSEPGR